MRQRISRSRWTGTREQALRRALKWLGYRPRSETEIRTKLGQLGFTSEVIQITLEKLRALHYIDDETFARDWARARIAGRGYGPLRIERELRSKGVDTSIIRRVLSEHFGERQGRERGQALLARRFRGQDLTDVKILRRAVGFLQRRGYTNAVIAELIRQPVEDE